MILLSRRVAREKVVQALYQMDMTGVSADEAISSVLGDNVSQIPVDFIQDLVRGTENHQADIDRVISSFLQGWTLGRLSYVDRSILRMAVYELMYRSDIPEKVTLNEAIELSKSFSTEESSRFINGVLSNILHQYIEAASDREGLKGDS